MIPSTRVSPNGLGILKAYPAPNLTTPINGNQNWFLAAQHPQYQRKDTVAVDINLTEKQRLRFRRVYFTFGSTSRSMAVQTKRQNTSIAPTRPTPSTTSGPSARRK